MLELPIDSINTSCVFEVKFLSNHSANHLLINDKLLGHFWV